MNRSKIEWCDHTWNPITGCRHACEYCYARKMSLRFSGDIRLNKAASNDYCLQEAPDGSGDLYILDNPMLSETGNALVYPFGFEPTLHRYRFNILDKLKMGNNIFVGAMADLFGEWVPDEWLDEIFKVCEKNPIHNYLFLTKNPEKYTGYGVPIQQENLWYGTTITCDADADKFNYLPAFCNTFVSIEPLMGDIAAEHNVMFRQVNWIIIGAETGRQKNKVVPEFEWIKKIVVEADYNGVPVFMKDSLVEIIGEKNMRRQFPEQLQKKSISPKMENKLFGTCCICKTYMKKSTMLALCVRSQRGEQPKQFAFMCDICFQNFCHESEIKIPELKKCIVDKTSILMKEGGFFG